MTTEEIVEMEKMNEANILAQNSAALSEFKRDCRVKALQIARDMKPHASYTESKQFSTPYYDLLAESEKIYQWLIKE